MRAYSSLSSSIRIAGIACILSAVSLTAFAAARPGRNEFSANATQIITGKKSHYINQRYAPFDSQPGPNKWIRLCMEGQDCFSVDDDDKRRSIFKA